MRNKDCGGAKATCHVRSRLNVFTWKFPRCQDELVFDVCWGGKMLWSSTRKIKPLHAQKGKEGLSISNCMLLNSPLKVIPD